MELPIRVMDLLIRVMDLPKRVLDLLIRVVDLLSKQAEQAGTLSTESDLRNGFFDPSAVRRPGPHDLTRGE